MRAAAIIKPDTMCLILALLKNVLYTAEVCRAETESYFYTWVHLRQSARFLFDLAH
jgi:hypothetical protein